MRTKSQFKNTNTLMVQGCTSDAGKSVVVAGLCRVYARHGYKVAPFKPQNMALNSAVTEDGGEIGRAQALQAVACNTAPRIDFNPILLKPSSDIGAQVIVHGKAVSTMNATKYHDYKTTAMDAVLASHLRLKREFETIVVEGAGSPAEINLRKGDIANMGFAEVVDCPVILIADIDKGGVFAHLVGTLELLSASEQSRIVGFVINKFRGDINLLKSGLDWLEQRTQKPVLGVIPYLHNLFLDAEDAINIDQPALADNPIRVVVPVLPRISNHTDFDALRLHPQVDLKMVSPDASLPPAELIILPGSKNVINDFKTLEKAGWHEKLQRHARYGGKVLGICGGYQMLGNEIHDPLGIENGGVSNSISGFGLLDTSTELAEHKDLKNVVGTIICKGIDNVTIQGYEIHCGQTITQEAAFAQLDNGQFEGSVSKDQQILGTYLHGMFDLAASSQAILEWLGLKNSSTLQDLSEIREQQLERLADTLQDSLDISTLFALTGTKPLDTQTLR